MNVEILKSFSPELPYTLTSDVKQLVFLAKFDEIRSLPHNERAVRQLIDVLKQRDPTAFKRGHAAVLSEWKKDEFDVLKAALRDISYVRLHEDDTYEWAVEVLEAWGLDGGASEAEELTALCPFDRLLNLLWASVKIDVNVSIEPGPKVCRVCEAMQQSALSPGDEPTLGLPEWDAQSLLGSDSP